MSVLTQTAPAPAALFTVHGDLVMSQRDEYQWALTAADLHGPLPPASLRQSWLDAGAVSGLVPWRLLGSFYAPAPFQGDFACIVDRGVGWGADQGNYFNLGQRAAWLLFLVDPTVADLPSAGPWPFAGRVAGVVKPSNYDITTPIGAILYDAQGNDYANGIIRTLTLNISWPNPGYSLGYYNDAVEGWTACSPAGPWSTADGLGGRSLGGSVQGQNESPPDAIWPLVGGRTYAVMAVPYAIVRGVLPGIGSDWAGAFLLSGDGQRGSVAAMGTGYEDSPPYAADPTDHWTVPDVHGQGYFAWPQYDPPTPPPGYGLTIGHGSDLQGGRPTYPFGLVPPGLPPAAYHMRTGQRLHLEAYGVTVQAQGQFTSPPVQPPPGPPPGAPGTGFPWWLLLLGAAGGGAVIYLTEKDRRKRRAAAR